MFFLTAISILLFLRLGFWQLYRADEKKTMLTAQTVLAGQKSLLWSVNKPLPEQYQNISVKGRYLPDTFLLDNQHQQHQFGYDVLTPLELTPGTVVMVDRGWVPGDNSRRVVPKIKSPEGDIQIGGSAYFPNKKQWVLGVDYELKDKNITVIERIDAKLLEHLLQKKVYPFIIRLDKQEEDGFTREWAIVSMPPERHLGYAFQWFAMAFVIFILFVALNLKKKDE